MQIAGRSGLGDVPSSGVVTAVAVEVAGVDGGYYDHYEDQDLLEKLGRRLKLDRYPSDSEATQALHVDADPDSSGESKGAPHQGNWRAARVAIPGGSMAVSGTRVISRSTAFSDARERWPNWTIKTTPLYGLGELFDLDANLILVDPKKRGAAYAVAHALAHQDLGHVRDTVEAFTSQQEQDAHDLATLRSDEEGSMSVYDRWQGPRSGVGQRWEVRWRQGGGQRKQRFVNRGAAEAFDAKRRVDPQSVDRPAHLPIDEMVASYLPGIGGL